MGAITVVSRKAFAFAFAFAFFLLLLSLLLSFLLSGSGRAGRVPGHP